MAKENDKVTLVKKGYEGRVGIIDSIIDPDLYIVRLEDKELVKCLENDIVLMVKERESDQTITISKDDLITEINNIVNSIVSEIDGAYVTTISLVGTLIAKRLEKRLFND